MNPMQVRHQGLQTSAAAAGESGAAPMSEVDAAFARLTQSMKRLDEIHLEMMRRLAPVTRSVGVSDQKSLAPAPRPVLCPIANTIDVTADRVDSIVNGLSEQLDALAI